MTALAVGFDFDRTLGFDNGLENVAFGRLAAELGVQAGADAPARQAVIERDLAAFRAAEISMETMIAAFAAALPLPARDLPGNAALAERYRELCYALVDDLVRPVTGAVACIDELVASGIRVGILTNGWSPLQERKIARALGRFPGPILVSAAIGAYKPSARAFSLLEAALNCQPSDLWYVGDNPVADVDGARAYGLRAVWLSEPSVPYPDGLMAPTARIDLLQELPAIVRGA